MRVLAALGAATILAACSSSPVEVTPPPISYPAIPPAPPPAPPRACADKCGSASLQG
ncbi:MAG: hypothetical protein JWQ29_210, partial [Phenylobacterium sp.]|nr:hypothetical protein [Phenylobacterium sp.]